VEVKKFLSLMAMTGVLVFGGAASCEKPEGTPFYEVTLEPTPEVEDCDAEDIAKKDWKDCPHLFQSPRPVRTAYQPAPTRIRRK
jgi:hypothetical protein